MSSTLPLLIVFGAGGHGRVAADAALASRRWRMVVASDRRAELWGSELLPGVKILAPEQLADLPGPLQLHVAIGANPARQREAQQLRQELPGAELVSIVHPQAAVAPSSVIGAGCLIAAMAVLAPLARLGQGVIVNHGAVVDHDCQVGDWSHLAPGCRLGGGAEIGARALLGANSTLLPLLRAGDDVLLGAGAVATHHLEPGSRWAGVPARRLDT